MHKKSIEFYFQKDICGIQYEGLHQNSLKWEEKTIDLALFDNAFM